MKKLIAIAFMSAVALAIVAPASAGEGTRTSSPSLRCETVCVGGRCVYCCYYPSGTICN